MSTPEALRTLCAVLAELYPDKASSIRVAEDAGIPLGLVALRDRALDNWHAILKEAQKRNRLAPLLAVVKEEYGENADFHAIYQESAMPSVATKQRTCAIIISIGILSFALWLVVPAMIQQLLPISTPTAQPTPASFTYGVTVTDRDTGQPIANATVRIDVEGKAPLDEYTDSNGFARVLIPAALAERPGRLSVEADGYEVEWQDIDLWEERLPNTVRLARQ